MANERRFSFNLSNDNYLVFIQQVRDWAKHPNRVSHGRPVLPYPPPTLRQAEYANIQLRARDQSKRERIITARIRRHDLYIVAYQMEQSNLWLEFEPDKGTPTVVPNSKTLGFGGNYNDLGKLENLGNVGYSTLKNSILDLAVTTDSNTRKSSLRALLVMISESVRFQKLSDLFAPMVHRQKDVKYETWMKTLINDWGSLSNRLLCEDQFGIYFRLPDKAIGKPHDLTKELGIVTSSDAAKCIAVLLGNTPDREALYQGDTALRWKGSPLLEVFAVGINKFAGEIYGKIQVQDGLGTTYLLYNRERSDFESIQNSGPLTLAGPNRGLSTSSFKVTYNLKQRAKSPSLDTEIIKGDFERKPSDISQIFDRRAFYTLKGKNGSSATVYFTSFRDAVQATVEIVLVNGEHNKEQLAQFYGSLVARYGKHEYHDEESKLYYRTTLFKKLSKENSVKVKLGNPIPLSRSVLAVPTSESLVIDADIISVGSKNDIAKGSADFPCQLDGNSMKDIKGNGGLVRITVAWKAKISA